jgi:DNA-binding beta-propeller fold protein YncE
MKTFASLRFPRLHFALPLHAALLASALFLAGCNLFEEDGSSPTPTIVGSPLDSVRLHGVSALEIRNGKLYVANGIAGNSGIEVFDAATGDTIAYHAGLTLPPKAMARTADGHLVISGVAGDYSSGALSVLNLAGDTLQNAILSFGTDATVTAADGKVFTINRTTGVVTGFTGHTPGQNVVFDVQTGAGSNPYGIAISGGKAYIPRYNKTSLLILNDASALGGGTRDSIDLSAYAKDTASGAPRMALITAHGGYVFVALQRLNHLYAAEDTSLVVVINASTKAIVKVIPLTFKNPIAGSVRDGVWYLTGIAGYGDKAGGVEKINLATRAHAGTVVTEETLGADVFDFVSAGSGLGYAAYSVDYGVHTYLTKVSH